MIIAMLMEEKRKGANRKGVDCDSWGRGFESRWPPQFLSPQLSSELGVFFCPVLSVKKSFSFTCDRFVTVFLIPLFATSQTERRRTWLMKLEGWAAADSRLNLPHAGRVARRILLLISELPRTKHVHVTGPGRPKSL